MEGLDEILHGDSRGKVAKGFKGIAPVYLQTAGTVGMRMSRSGHVSAPPVYRRRNVRRHSLLLPSAIACGYTDEMRLPDVVFMEYYLE